MSKDSVSDDRKHVCRRVSTGKFEIHENKTVTLSPQKDSWELLEEIQQVPRQTDKSVDELLAESKNAWSKYE